MHLIGKQDTPDVQQYPVALWLLLGQQPNVVVIAGQIR